jgi:hypothetical protein
MLLCEAFLIEKRGEQYNKEDSNWQLEGEREHLVHEQTINCS